MKQTRLTEMFGMDCIPAGTRVKYPNGLATYELEKDIYPNTVKTSIRRVVGSGGTGRIYKANVSALVMDYREDPENMTLLDLAKQRSIDKGTLVKSIGTGRVYKLEKPISLDQTGDSRGTNIETGDKHIALPLDRMILSPDVETVDATVADMLKLKGFVDHCTDIYRISGGKRYDYVTRDTVRQGDCKVVCIQPGIEGDKRYPIDELYVTGTANFKPRSEEEILESINEGLDKQVEDELKVAIPKVLEFISEVRNSVRTSEYRFYFNKNTGILVETIRDIEGNVIDTVRTKVKKNKKDKNDFVFAFLYAHALHHWDGSRTEFKNFMDSLVEPFGGNNKNKTLGMLTMLYYADSPFCNEKAVAFYDAMVEANKKDIEKAERKEARRAAKKAKKNDQD